MNKYYLIIILFATLITAQEKTIIQSDSVIVGWFGSPVVKFSEINNDRAFFLGGEAGVILNHHVVLGIGGYWLFTKVKANEVVAGKMHNINFAYGGVKVEYIHKWEEIVHYTASLLIGGGSVSYRDNLPAGEFMYLNDQFFAAEPGANIEFNFTDFFRIDIGASYRFVSKIFFGELTAHHLDGFTTNITLKFGDF